MLIAALQTPAGEKVDHDHLAGLVERCEVDGPRSVEQRKLHVRHSRTYHR